jgi:hypothetical protein
MFVRNTHLQNILHVDNGVILEDAIGGNVASERNSLGHYLADEKWRNEYFL